MENFKKIILKIFFFIKNDAIKRIKNIVLSYKSLCNIFLIFSILMSIFWFFLKIYYEEFFKKNEIYKYIILNFIFFIIGFYLSNIKLFFCFLLDNIYLEIGTENLNILSVFLSLIWIVFTFFLCMYDGLLFEIIIEEMEEIDLNLKFLLFRAFNFLTFFLILFLGFAFMNLDIFILTVIGAAFGLGLSMTIQKLISNYISGLIILSDRAFKIGDAVSLNGYQGVITQISNRYVMLRNLDCSEVLVPNERFLNDVIQNQSLFFAKGNLRVTLQISYDNDIDLVLNILVKSLNGVERVLENPVPISYFTTFILNGIELELSFWIIDAVRGAALVRSEVNINIWNNLKKNNIELLYNRKLVKVLN